MPNLPYISPQLLEEYQEEVGSQVSQATTKRRMSALKRFFGWAEKEGHIPENPIPQSTPLIEAGAQIIPVKKLWFKPVNILKVGIPAALVVLLFLLARQVKFPIPFLPAPALEPGELTGLTPASPTPQPLAGPTPQATASGEIDPIFSKIYKDGVLTLEGLSPALKAIGGLLIEGGKVIIKTTDTSDGDIEINPDGSGIAHFLFEGTGQNFLNAQAPNLTTGSLYYGIVANNAVGYDLLRLQSGSKPITRFSVDALGNTEVGGNLDLAGNLSTLNVIRLTSGGSLTNITGYSQISGNFTVSQAGGNTATITKKASALNDVLTLTLDERGAANSNYSTLTLKRYDGAIEAMALFVDEGNARFDGQVQLGRFSSNPTTIGQGSLIFNTSDTSLYIWNGSSWVNLGGGSVSGFWQRNLGALSPTNITDDVLTGGTATASALVRLPGLNNQDSWFNLGTGNVGIGDTTPDAKLEVLSTSEQLRLTNVDDTTDCRFTVSSTGDMTIDCLGSGTTDQLVLGDGDTINIGSGAGSDLAYNRIGNAADAPEEAAIASDNDLYIGGDLEVDGTIYGTVTGTLSWSSLTDPVADLSLGHFDATNLWNTTFTWNTPTTALAEDAFTLAFVNDATTDANTQRLLVLKNSDDAGTTGTLEALLVLDNADANEAVTDGLIITSTGAGGITTAININDTDIVTDIKLQFGETIDNNTDGTIALTTTTLSSGATTVNFASAALTVSSCTGCGGGAASWSSLSAPTADLTLAHTTWITEFNWDTGTGTNNLFSFTTDASSNGTGSLVNIQTGTSSTVLPLRVRAGATEAITVDSAGNVGIGNASPTTALHIGTNAETRALSTGDVLIRSDLELDGILYLDGRNIADTNGTNTIIFCTQGGANPCTDAAQVTKKEHTLSSGSWIVSNDANVGKAALIVSQTKDGDIFTASSGATPTTRFTIANNGNVTISGSGTMLTVGGGTGKIDVG
ncbi:hypothetical protein HYT60_01400, partial [Candidatus Woesebacteria bacterium]|nr:hypothetical protein [Candidatus Woesebacteria bacterium]